jgi:predicted ester cyclase
MFNIQRWSKPAIQFVVFFFLVTGLYGQEKVADLQANKKIASSYITEVVNNRRLSLLGEIYAPAYIFHEMDGRERHTISDSSLVTFLKYLFKAFPDLNYTIDNIVAENDLVALNLTATGTQKDEFLGHAATNRRIRFKEMFFFRLAGLRIVEGWGVVDVNGVIGQIK